MALAPRKAVLTALILVLGCGEHTAPRHYLAETPVPDRGFDYPGAYRSDVVDVFHGYEVADPYRWLEDSDSDETRAWIRAQNELTRAYFAKTSTRSRLRRRLEELWDHPRFEAPIVRGGLSFYLANDGLQEQSVLLVADGTGRRARQLLDPSRWSADGTVVLAGYEPSEGGTLLAYGVSDGGSDWRTWHVLDVATGNLLPDRVTGNKFGGVQWAPDDSGFFYSRFERPPTGAPSPSGGVARDEPPEICFHRIGRPEDEDEVVVPRPEQPGILQSFSVTDDGRALVVVRRDSRTRKDEVDLVPLVPGSPDAEGEGGEPTGWRARRIEASNRPEVVRLAGGYDARYEFVGGGLDRVWLSTDLEAPRGRVIAVDPSRPERRNWESVVPEGEDAVESADLVGSRLVVRYLTHATSRVEVFDPSGTHAHTVDLPGIGSVQGFTGRPGDREAFFTFTSFTTPPTVYRYDLERAGRRIWAAPDVDLDPEDFETRQVFFESRDGTRIPMFVTHRKGIELDGSNPTYLYGYGGFDVSLKPWFSVPHVVWMEEGGILAVPNLRGGGEYGEEWHAAGARLSKQNVFDDFIAAAEHLIDAGYTSTRRLAIGGRSNGGLLVGACMTQRPDLFGAAVPAVGVLDMLRYHRFTIGWAWAGEYGTAENRDEFRTLLQYSPYHNLHPGTDYPATLILTADHDDRVVPAHSFKFAAALQAAHTGDEPILIRIETRAGHGAGTPLSKRIAEEADRMAFLLRELNAE